MLKDIDKIEKISFLLFCVRTPFPLPCLCVFVSPKKKKKNEEKVVMGFDIKIINSVLIIFFLQVNYCLMISLAG